MSNLSQYYPRWKHNREEVIAEIQSSSKLSQTFYSWKKEDQERFLDICTGNRGLRILYDVYFQEIFNPDANPERLADLLSVLLEKDVETVTYMRRESSLIDDNWNLLVLDIVVRLKDGSIVNVEMQKIGYRFPGERACCYSADLVLRQYSMGKRSRRDFTYRDMKPVYSVIFIENSTGEFHKLEGQYIHRFSQKSDTGLKLPLLQHYIFVPLDMFKKEIDRKKNEKLTRLEAWLLFLASDDPADIQRIVEEYPEFGGIYEQIFEICQSVERMINMFSKELAAIDRNTVKYMIDELQEELNAANAKAGEAQNKAVEAQNRAAVEAARADEAQKKVAEADAEIRKLREKQMEDAKKQETEIRLMYEQGLSIEAVCSIKEMDIEEIKRILFRN